MLVKNSKEKSSLQQVNTWIFHIELLLLSLFTEKILKLLFSFPPFLFYFQQMNKSMVLEPVRIRFKSWLCHILTVLFRETYFISLILSLFLYKMQLIICSHIVVSIGTSVSSTVFGIQSKHSMEITIIFISYSWTSHY